MRRVPAFLSRSWLVPLALVAVAAPCAGETGAAGSLSTAVDSIFAPAAGRPLPGGVVVVLRDGAVVHAKAYGLSSLAAGESNTTRTRFRLASVTKSFTALAVMQLVEQGRLDLDDPLEKYLPGFVGGERIRIRHLLSHTAGLPDFMSLDEAMKLPPDGAPGERLNYSNIGYAALGRVIEKVTGVSYGEHLRRAIFEPLGMAETGVDGREPTDKGDAVGYLFTADGGTTKAEYTVTGRDAAAGGLHSTAEDMTRWLQALLANRIVKADTFARMARPAALSGGRQAVYGFGFMLAPYRGVREVGHGGDISGFNTWVALYPDERLGVIVLCNYGMRPPGPLPTAGDVAHEVLGAVAGARLGPEWPLAASVPASVLQRYAGRYRLAVPPPVAEVMGDAIAIQVEGTRVTASGKQGAVEIFPENATSFFSKAGPVRLTFLPRADGSCDEGVLSLMGLREFRLQRER
jgi:CubicO group peptidase (beta-lactamase class C family)